MILVLIHCFLFQRKEKLASYQPSEATPATLSDQWQPFMLIWGKLEQVKYDIMSLQVTEGPFPLRQQFWDLLLDHLSLFTEKNFHLSHCCWWVHWPLTCQISYMSHIKNNKEIISLPSKFLPSRMTGLPAFYSFAANCLNEKLIIS